MKQKIEKNWFEFLSLISIVELLKNSVVRLKLATIPYL